MSDTAYVVSDADRRPIKARKLAVMGRVAQRWAAAGVSPNLISVVGMLCCVAAGAAVAATPYAGDLGGRLLWLIAAGLVQLRLLGNLLDGMVAVAAKTASAGGEIYNEAPDRVSDVATLVGLGYAVGGLPVLGWAAAVGAVGTAYVRMLGKSAGAGSDFRGPMAKQHRMACVTVLAVLNAILPMSVQRFHPAGVCLTIIVVGCVLTIGRRLSRIGRVLRGEL